MLPQVVAFGHDEHRYEASGSACHYHRALRLGSKSRPPSKYLQSTVSYPLLGSTVHEAFCVPCGESRMCAHSLNHIITFWSSHVHLCKGSTNVPSILPYVSCLTRDDAHSHTSPCSIVVAIVVTRVTSILRRPVRPQTLRRYPAAGVYLRECIPLTGSIFGCNIHRTRECMSRYSVSYRGGCVGCDVGE